METANIGRPAAKVKVELTDEERIEIETLAQGTDEVAEKAKFLLDLATGEKTRLQLMTEYSKNRQQILNFIARFQKYRVDAVKKKYIFSKEPIRHSKATKETVNKLLTIAQQSPRELGYEFDNWTLLKLSEHLKEKENVSLTRERIRQILLKHGTQHHTARQMPSANK